MTRVAFQGEQGAYSEEAVRQHFGPDVASRTATELPARLRRRGAGDSDYGMLPSRTRVAGSVIANYDLLLESDLRSRLKSSCECATTCWRRKGPRQRTHAWFALILSALAQCERYLASRGWDPQPVYDTAGAAKDLAPSRSRAVAAIASRLAGEIYGLRCWTRHRGLPLQLHSLFVLGAPPPPRPSKARPRWSWAGAPSRSSVRVPREFATRGINLPSSSLARGATGRGSSLSTSTSRATPASPDARGYAGPSSDEPLS